MSAEQSRKRAFTPDIPAEDFNTASLSPPSNSDSDNLSTLERKSKRQRTQEEKKYDRIMANRRSAKESRERKKKMMEKLELSVKRLANENDELRKLNEDLRCQVGSLIRAFEAKQEDNVATALPLKEQALSLPAQPNLDQILNAVALQGWRQAVPLDRSGLLPSYTNQASADIVTNKHIAALLPQKTRSYFPSGVGSPISTILPNFQAAL